MLQISFLVICICFVMDWSNKSGIFEHVDRLVGGQQLSFQSKLTYPSLPLRLSLLLTENGGIKKLISLDSMSLANWKDTHSTGAMCIFYRCHSRRKGERGGFGHIVFTLYNDKCNAQFAFLSRAILAAHDTAILALTLV